MIKVICVLTVALCGSVPYLAGASPADTAREIFDLSGVQGGLVLHIGSGNGELTAALRANDSYVVHALETDAAQVEKARARIRAQGSYGPVSVEHWNAAHLPHADNLVNLVVAEDLGRIPMLEVLRVLVPNGVACIQKDGAWTKTVKPRPNEIDEWSHFLHDAGNNAVAQDQVVGPPRRMQWNAPPLWLRSHETASGIQGQVSAGGRIFYLFDEGPVGITDERLPNRWSIISRDAFNGKLLWKRPIEEWGWREWGRETFENKDWLLLYSKRGAFPIQNERRLVAHGDYLYATPGFSAPLSILDAATGKTLATVDGTENTDEVLLSNGVLLAYVAQAAPGANKRRGQTGAGKQVLVAADGVTGEVLWRKPVKEIVPLGLAADGERILLLSNSQELDCLSLRDGEIRWTCNLDAKGGKTLVIEDGVALVLAASWLRAQDVESGELLWRKAIPARMGSEREDLFVVKGVVWTGALMVGKDLEPKKKTPGALLIGRDLRTGAELQRVYAEDFRSPEHHHRCYRNKATERFVISSVEGAEFMALDGAGHSANNFVRGACKQGMMPCNGLLYVPPDQCFCQPGAKLLGYAALAPAEAFSGSPIAADQRLLKGPAYGATAASGPQAGPGDWPTFRQNAARGGTTPTPVASKVSEAWRTRLQSPLTPPVAVGDRLYVVEKDAHTVHALDSADGALLWSFTANARIDSPPTIHHGLVLFGSRDGRVYCLRASDGALAWRFTAAPLERRVGYFDQIESAWPVHGSVLMHDGTAYATAGRSSYLDGGIWVYGLDPDTGRVLYQTVLEGPYPEDTGERDKGFYLMGANSDVLVSEGGYLYMRQKKLTPQLEEVHLPVLSSKGAMDVGLHLFSTAGLLDDSWYNRTFWMYAKRWPGFQLANQAPKAGQLLVFDEDTTFGVKVFYHRNQHSPMFFPAREGYLLFADKNTTEPQIVGEEGARPPLRWLPQSDYARKGGAEIKTLDSEAFGGDKWIGYTRADPALWTQFLPVRIRAMVKAAGTVFVAGAPDVLDPEDPFGGFEGRKGGRLVAVSKEDGKTIAELALDSPPVFDGMIAANGRLYLSLRDGSVLALAGERVASAK